MFTPVVFEDEEVVGILPLVVVGRRLRFLGQPASDYNDLLCEGDRVGKILITALSCLESSVWDTCELENLPEHSYIVRSVPDISTRLGKSVELVYSTSCPTLRLFDRKQEILKDIFRKQDVRRNEKRLQKLGTLRFRHIESGQEIQAHLQRFFHQHISRWAVAGIESRFINVEDRNFLITLVNKLDPAKELRFSVLELDGKPIAYHLGFQLDGKYTSYTPTFDVDLWEYSPGGVLLRNLFKYIQNNCVQELDFTRGDEAYKSRFANHVNRNFTLYLHSSTFRSHGYRVARSLKIRLRQQPRILGFLKIVRSALVPLMHRARTSIRRDGVLALSKRFVFRAFRAAVFTNDEVLVFSVNNSLPLADAALPLSDELIVRPASLGELADISIRYPDVFDVKNLAIGRERLKDGDTAFVAYKHQRPAHVAWMRIRSDILASEVGAKCRIALTEPAAVIYDCLTHPDFRGQGIYPRVLRAIIDDASRKGLDAWIYCMAENVASQRGIEKAGFVLRNRMSRTRLFRWLQWSSVVRE